MNRGERQLVQDDCAAARMELIQKIISEIQKLYQEIQEVSAQYWENWEKNFDPNKYSGLAKDPKYARVLAEAENDGPEIRRLREQVEKLIQLKTSVYQMPCGDVHKLNNRWTSITDNAHQKPVDLPRINGLDEGARINAATAQLLDAIGGIASGQEWGGDGNTSNDLDSHAWRGYQNGQSGHLPPDIDISDFDEVTSQDAQIEVVIEDYDPTSGPPAIDSSDLEVDIEENGYIPVSEIKFDVPDNAELVYSQEELDQGVKALQEAVNLRVEGKIRTRKELEAQERQAMQAFREGRLSGEDLSRIKAEIERIQQASLRLDLYQKPDHTIHYGAGSFVKLLPDGTIHSHEYQSFEGSSFQTYENWTYTDGSQISRSMQREINEKNGDWGKEVSVIKSESIVVRENPTITHVLNHAETGTKSNNVVIESIEDDGMIRRPRLGEKTPEILGEKQKKYRHGPWEFGY